MNQSINLPSNLSDLEFHANGLVGKKSPDFHSIYRHMAAVIMYSPSSHWTSFCKGLRLPVPTTKSTSLSLSQLLSTLRIYMFWGNEQRKFIIANKASCE
jgi:hypothetical protein